MQHLENECVQGYAKAHEGDPTICRIERNQEDVSAGNTGPADRRTNNAYQQVNFWSLFKENVVKLKVPVHFGQWNS